MNQSLPKGYECIRVNHGVLDRLPAEPGAQMMGLSTPSGSSPLPQRSIWERLSSTVAGTDDEPAGDCQDQSLFVVRHIRYRAVVGLALVGQMSPLRARRSGHNPCTPFDDMAASSTAAMRHAVLAGKAAELQLLCVRNGCHEQKIGRFLLRRVIESVNLTRVYSHLFVELSPASVNGMRMCVLQHTLENVFGFTRLTLVLEALTYWYVCSLDMAGEARVPGLWERLRTWVRPESAERLPPTAKAMCIGLGWRPHAIASTFVKHDMHGSLEAGTQQRDSEEAAQHRRAPVPRKMHRVDSGSTADSSSISSDLLFACREFKKLSSAAHARAAQSDYEGSSVLSS